VSSTVTDVPATETGHDGSFSVVGTAIAVGVVGVVVALVALLEPPQAASNVNARDAMNAERRMDPPVIDRKTQTHASHYGLAWVAL
jgi:hypothetical protein